MEIDSKNGKILPVLEEFYSLQGEGYHMGKAAYFIRLGGCDIGCSWCDSKQSWNPLLHKATHIDDLLQRAVALPAKAVVVTGGEPTLYNLDPLCNLLKNNGISTYLETSGAYKLTGIWDWICLSPKQGHHPLDEFYNQSNELKVIIYRPEDFLWAEDCAGRVSPGCRLYLQPEWSRFSQNIESIVNYILSHPKWRISVQAHKYMNIP